MKGCKILKTVYHYADNMTKCEIRVSLNDDIVRMLEFSASSFGIAAKKNKIQKNFTIFGVSNLKLNDSIDRAAAQKIAYNKAMRTLSKRIKAIFYEISNIFYEISKQSLDEVSFLIDKSFSYNSLIIKLIEKD